MVTKGNCHALSRYVESLHNNDKNDNVMDSDTDTLASFDSINEGQWSPRELPCTFQVCGMITQQYH